MIGTKSPAVLALLALTFAAAALLAEDRMRAGLWEVTTTLDGKQSGTMGGTCYTPAMVALGNMPANTIREETEKSLSKRGHCTLDDFKLDGHKVSMTTTCGARHSEYQSTYSGDAFETLVTSTEAGVKQVIQMKGRRTGDCK